MAMTLSKYRLNKRMPLLRIPNNNFQRINFKRPSWMRMRRKRTTQGRTQDLNIGRRSVKIPVNLPRKLKMGKKHCNTLQSKSLIVFKDALIKKAFQVFYYKGIYKAIEISKYDNINWDNGTTGTSKTLVTNYLYGGALGHGIADISFTNDDTVGASLEIEQGNSLFICNDIPTGYFLPSSFTGDFWDATNTTGVSRLFGMAEQNAFDTRQMTALNGNEYDYRQNLVAKTIPSYAWRSLYTLYYKYEYVFMNYSVVPYIAWVIQVKLKDIKPEDSAALFGMSNWINKYTDKDPVVVYNSLRSGILPTCFSVVKKKKVVLGPVAAVEGAHVNAYQPFQRYGKITVKSSQGYVTSHRPPFSNDAGDIATVTNAWFNEKAMKYTYTIVYAIPFNRMQVRANASTSQLAGSAGVRCVVTKSTAYTLLDN